MLLFFGLIQVVLLFKKENTIHQPKTKITKQESLPQFLHHGDTGRDEGQYQSPSGKEGGKAAIVSDALVCSLFTQSEIRTLWRKKIVIGVWVFDVHVVGTPVCRITTNNAGMPSTHQCLDRHSCATCGRLQLAMPPCQQRDAEMASKREQSRILHRICSCTTGLCLGHSPHSIPQSLATLPSFVSTSAHHPLFRVPL